MSEVSVLEVKLTEVSSASPSRQHGLTPDLTTPRTRARTHTHTEGGRRKRTCCEYPECLLGYVIALHYII